MPKLLQFSVFRSCERILSPVCCAAWHVMFMVLVWRGGGDGVSVCCGVCVWCVCVVCVCGGVCVWCVLWCVWCVCVCVVVCVWCGVWSVCVCVVCVSVCVCCVRCVMALWCRLEIRTHYLHIHKHENLEDCFFKNIRKRNTTIARTTQHMPPQHTTAHTTQHTPPHTPSHAHLLSIIHSTPTYQTYNTHATITHIQRPQTHHLSPHTQPGHIAHPHITRHTPHTSHRRHTRRVCVMCCVVCCVYGGCVCVGLQWSSVRILATPPPPRSTQNTRTHTPTTHTHNTHHAAQTHHQYMHTILTSQITDTGNDNDNDTDTTHITHITHITWSHT